MSSSGQSFVIRTWDGHDVSVDFITSRFTISTSLCTSLRKQGFKRNCDSDEENLVSTICAEVLMALTQPVPSYPTPFKRHLAFFDHDHDGFIYLGDAIRGWLSLGLNFPVSLSMAMSMQVVYGNVGSPFYGPFRGIEIRNVQNERHMLQRLPVLDDHKGTLTRSQLLNTTKKRPYIDQIHVYGLWAIAANQEGQLASHDLKICQDGHLLPEIEKRRGDRSDILPFLRGGPISVSGHAWAAERMFGVHVYQEPKRNHQDK